MTSSTSSTYPEIWNLASLGPHPSSDEFKAGVQKLTDDFSDLVAAASKLSAVKKAFGDVGEEAIRKEWQTFLLDYEQTAQKTSDLNSLIGCYCADDAENTLYQQWEAKLASLQPLQDEICTTVEFLLKEADAESFDAMVQSSDVFQKRDFYLEELRSNTAFRMPQREEVLASQLDVHGIHAWSRLYDQLSGSLKIDVMEKGTVVKKSPSQVRYDSSERTVRENEFFASEKAWSSVMPTCATALNQIAGSRLVRYQKLGVEDHLSFPLHKNRMQRSTLNAMWGAISRRKEKLAGYLQTRAKLMGVEKLAWYDLYTTLSGSDSAGEKKVTYDEACEQILDAFGGFSDDLRSFSEMAMKEGWIEVENRAGKRQGGFCTGIPSHSQSRIFMTWTYSIDSLSTLAHELGHAYHSWILKDEPFFHQDYPMNLAETASTFAETVVGRQIIDRTENPKARLAILDKMLQDSVAFLMNIHCRFLFEDRFHQARHDGELSAETLSEMMVTAQKEAYQNELADDGWNPTFWVSKLHFYISGYPFYNFPYTFGYLLSQGIYQLGDEYGDEFPQRYCDFLKATGSMSAEQSVDSSFGKDITTEAFWDSCIDIIDARADEFQALAAQFL